VWGKGSVKFNFIFDPHFSAYVEGYVRGAMHSVMA
jgi:hypothetical protein